MYLVIEMLSIKNEMRDRCENFHILPTSIEVHLYKMTRAFLQIHRSG